MTIRKRDDLPENMLYRVVCRREGSDDEWTFAAGYRRTYHTLGAARGVRGRAVGEHERRARYVPDQQRLEFAVQRAPVIDWEVVPNEA